MVPVCREIQEINHNEIPRVISKFGIVINLKDDRSYKLYLFSIKHKTHTLIFGLVVFLIFCRKIW